MTNFSASDLAGKRIREAREAKGWRVKDLADHCAKAGAGHITAAVITNLETRRRATREITADELLALAYVLDVPPVQLISPLNGDERLEVVPGVMFGPLEATGWIADDASVLDKVRQSRRPEPQYTQLIINSLPTQPNKILTALRQLREMSVKVEARHAQIASDPENASYYERMIAIFGGRILYILNWLAVLEREPPEMPEVMDILREHGVTGVTDVDEGADDGQG